MSQRQALIRCVLTAFLAVPSLGLRASNNPNADLAVQQASAEGGPSAVLRFPSFVAIRTREGRGTNRRPQAWSFNRLHHKDGLLCAAFGNTVFEIDPETRRYRQTSLDALVDGLGVTTQGGWALHTQDRTFAWNPSEGRPRPLSDPKDCRFSDADVSPYAPGTPEWKDFQWLKSGSLFFDQADGKVWIAEQHFGDCLAQPDIFLRTCPGTEELNLAPVPGIDGFAAVAGRGNFIVKGPPGSTDRLYSALLEDGTAEAIVPTDSLIRRLESAGPDPYQPVPLHAWLAWRDRILFLGDSLALVYGVADGRWSVQTGPGRGLSTMLPLPDGRVLVGSFTDCGRAATAEDLYPCGSGEGDGGSDYQGGLWSWDPLTADWKAIKTKLGFEATGNESNDADPPGITALRLRDGVIDADLAPPNSVVLAQPVYTLHFRASDLGYIGSTHRPGPSEDEAQPAVPSTDQVLLLGTEQPVGLRWVNPKLTVKKVPLAHPCLQNNYGC